MSCMRLLEDVYFSVVINVQMLHPTATLRRREHLSLDYKTSRDHLHNIILGCKDKMMTAQFKSIL